MPNYQNGKIYKIISFDNPDICYIGSTTQTLAMRMGGHRRCYNEYLKVGKTRKYTTACKMVCYPDARIYLIESYNCDNKNELERREGEIIKKFMKDDQLENPVNFNIAGRTNKEWQDDNKEKHKEYQKQYQINNSEKLKEHRKKYHENNKETIKEQKKQHYHNNKETINEQRKIKINCEYCNRCIRKGDIKKHHRTIRCQSVQ